MSKLSLEQISQTGLQNSLQVNQFLNSTAGHATRALASREDALQKKNIRDQLIELIQSERHIQNLKAFLSFLKKSRAEKKRRHDAAQEAIVHYVEETTLHTAKQSKASLSDTPIKSPGLILINPFSEHEVTLEEIQEELKQIAVEMENINNSYVSCENYLKLFFAACPPMLEPERIQELMTKAKTELAQLFNVDEVLLQTKYNSIIDSLQLTLTYLTKPSAKILCDERGLPVANLEDAAYILPLDKKICHDGFGKVFLLSNTTVLEHLNEVEQEEAHLNFLNLRPTFMTPKCAMSAQRQQDENCLLLKQEALLAKQQKMQQELTLLKSKATQSPQENPNSLNQSYKTILSALTMQPKPEMVRVQVEKKKDEVKPLERMPVTQTAKPNFTPIPSIDHWKMRLRQMGPDIPRPEENGFHPIRKMR